MEQNSTHRLDLDFYEYIIAFNCTLQDTYIAAIIDQLDLKFIKNESVKAYLGIIFDFYNKHSKCPSSTEIKSYLSSDELKKHFKHVVLKFKDLDTEYDIDELLYNSEQYIKERAVFHAVKDTVDEVTSDNAVDTTSIFERFENATTISLVEDLGLDYFNEIDRHIDDLTVVKKYISTGYKWLDKMLGGGFLENGRALYNFVGATNCGKSIVLANLAGNVLKNDKTVVVITLEMPEMVYAQRVSSKLTGIPTYDLCRETDTLKAFVRNHQNENPSGNLIIKEFPPNSVTPNHIKAFLIKLVNKKRIRDKKFKIDLVVLDYLTLLQAPNSDGSLYADGKKVAEQIRALSYPQNFGCPFVTAGQSNRTGYDENPTIQSTGESIAIPQTVDFQAALWSTDEDKELGILHMGLQKSRFGPNRGVQAFRIDYDTLTISETDAVFGASDELNSIENALDILEK